MNKDKYGFKRDMKTALENLQSVGAIEGYVIEGELVSVERKPTPSQQRHLKATKNPKPKP
jgi:hypothetical protein